MTFIVKNPAVLPGPPLTRLQNANDVMLSDLPDGALCLVRASAQENLELRYRLDQLNTSHDLRAALQAGALTANDGVADLSAADAIKLLGRDPYQTVQLLGSTRATKREEAITTIAPSWQYLESVETNPGFFSKNLAMLLARVVGRYRSTGASVEIQIVENDGVTDIVVGSTILGDTAGSWLHFEFNSNVTFRIGDNEYRLEARRNGATSADIRSASMTLLKIG